MSQPSTGSTHHEHGFAHPMPIPMLLAVFGALIFLTFATVLLNGAVPDFLELPVAMFIATIKALLVMLFFMHMVHDKAFNVFAFLSSVVFLALFVVFTLVDTAVNQPAIDEYRLTVPLEEPVTPPK
jgi:cytochrome c oxidase subunit 4